MSKPTPLDELTIETDALGKTTASEAIDELFSIAEPGFAPKAWQAHAPDTDYRSTKMPVADSAELQRVLALPRRPQVMPGSREAELLVKVVTKRYAMPAGACRCAEVLERHKRAHRACIKELNLAQSWGLYEIAQVAGLLGPIGVGHGKTILNLLTPLAMPGCRKAVLLVPVNLIPQLIFEYEFVGNHFRMPTLIVWGKVKLPGDTAPRDYNNPRYHPVTGEPEPTLYVFAYSKLQHHSSSVALDEIAPDTIIADEAHNLRHADSVRTARVLRYADNHPNASAPVCVRAGNTELWTYLPHFSGVSGSYTDSSVRDYAHLAALALRDRSPLPQGEHGPEVTEDWARALDPKVNREGGGKSNGSPWALAAPPGALLQLCNPGEHVAEGFHRRLVETLGVVATMAPAIDAELHIEERTAPPVPGEVFDALEKLREDWERPDGEILTSVLDVARCARELACGFYYRWHFRHYNPPLPVSLILEWLDVRKEFRKEVRWAVRSRRPYMDSNYLFELAAQRYTGEIPILPCPPGVDPAEWEARHPVYESKMWPYWRDIRDKVKPKTEAVRISDYLARDAAEWALSNRGIVWYDSNEYGEWVAEITGDLGQQLTKHGGGPDAGTNIAREDGSRSIIASIKSHGTGRDGLQRIFHDQLVAQPPSSATTWEQLLGRLHRIGQDAPVVYARFYRHTDELAYHVDQALARALYVQTTLGSEQKLRCGFKLPAVDLTTTEVDLSAFDFAPVDLGPVCGHEHGEGLCHDCAE